MNRLSAISDLRICNHSSLFVPSRVHQANGLKPMTRVHHRFFNCIFIPRRLAIVYTFKLIHRHSIRLLLTVNSEAQKIRRGSILFLCIHFGCTHGCCRRYKVILRRYKVILRRYKVILRRYKVILRRYKVILYLGMYSLRDKLGENMVRSYTLSTYRSVLSTKI
jgi:hypothetical protein